MGNSKRPEPIVLTNNETNKTYILEFNRTAVKRAERNGFDITTVTTKMMSGLTDLFYYAFYMHHQNTVSREDADRILFDELGGMSDEMINRLAELYSYTLESLYSGEQQKNGMWAVKM